MKAKEFYRLLEFKPYRHQEEAYDRILSLEGEGGCVVIKAPTAAGKTEAAVAPYFAGVKDGSYPFAKLIYVLPTRALANAQKQRLEERIARKLGLNLRIVVDHGSAYHKPMLNGDVVICTLDAFIYGFAAQRTFGYRLHYPLGSIASSLVVFDEVQMYQDEKYYVPWLIGKIMKYLYRARIPFVVMTATLPEILEKILLNGVEVDDDNKIVVNTAKRGNVEVKNKDNLLKGDLLSESIDNYMDMINSHQKVGIILNTVAKAQNMFELIKDRIDKDVILLHSRITAKTREEREKQLNEDSEFVVIATQVIEAGLDVSLDFMLTEIAPIDALIQRIGRVARRKGEKGEAYIFDVDGNYAPYPKELLEKTKNMVENIEKCITNLDIAQEKINRVYKDISLIESELSIKASLYFDELRLFTLPPEYDLRVRPELYVTLFVPPAEKIEEIKEDASKDWNEKRLNPATDLDLDCRLRENTFNVSFSWINKNSDIILKDKNNYISIEWGFKDGRKIIGFCNRAKIIPYLTYVVNPEYYDEQLGLIGVI